MNGHHECPAPGCKASIPHHMLFCRQHWFMVPKPLRDEVWRTYRDEAGSADHRQAVAAAVDYVRGRLSP